MSNEALYAVSTETKFGFGILIGGQRMRYFDSTRHTEDVDYLVKAGNSVELFVTDEAGVDYINADAHKLYGAVFARDAKAGEASAQSLFDMKAFSSVQHFQNGNFHKAIQAEHDYQVAALAIVADGGTVDFKLISKHVSAGELHEIKRALKRANIEA